MAEYLLLPVSLEDAEAAGITENAVIESFVNEKGEIVIRALTDTGDYVCGQYCEACIFDEESCGRGKWAEPYVCRCRTVDPAKGGARLDGY